MRRLLLLALLLFVAPAVWSQTCHVVGPGATGSGNDFGHPMAMPGGGSWQRGHVYYFLPGSYSKPQPSGSGSGTITLRRASLADHGQTCTNAATVTIGYIDTTMGQPAGPAKINLIEVLGSDVVLDGSFHPTNWMQNGGGLNVQTGYGFWVDMNTACAAGDCWGLNLNNSGGNNNITVMNTGVYGRGDAATDTTGTDQQVRAVGTASNYIFQYLGLYNSSSTCFVFRNITGITIDHAWCEHNHATTGHHAEPISIAAVNNVTVSNSVFKDVEGTGVIVNLSDGTHFLTSDNWNIYGNLIFTQPGNPTGRSGMGNGTLSCINDQLSTNWRFVNNTIANMIGEARIYMDPGAGNCNSSAGLVVKNNIWYKNGVNVGFSVQPDAASYAGFDANSYIQNTQTNDVGSQTITLSAGPNPFVNTIQQFPPDYKLSSNTNVTPCLTCATTITGISPDAFGITRSLSRGAYELSGSTPTPPNPPTSLSASVSGSTVTISGTASTGSPPPTAYTLYRGSVSGGPYSIVKSGLSSPNTTDTPPNGTWFYVETSFVGGIISTITSSGGTATVTCTATCTSFPSGTAFTIGGNSVSGFNGTFTSTGQPTGTTFTFASSAIGPGSGGGAWPNNLESAKSNQVQAVVPAALILTLSPASRTFASQTVGTTSAAQSFTATNASGPGQSITISNITYTGANPGDFGQTNNCPGTLTSGSSCTINATFTPTAAGARSATLTITDNAAGSPHTATVNGTGVATTPAVSLTPSAIIFGDQLTGTTSTSVPATLQNTGTGTLSITSIVATGDFGQSNGCGASLAPSASCTINVTFTPTATGTRTGSIQVTDNASGSPHTVTLSGTGITSKCSFTGTGDITGAAGVCQ